MKQYSFLTETKIQDLVKDEEWQTLRSSLVGTWKTNPERNCKLLKQYLGDIHTCEYKKLRIVLNYLTGSGFRIGIIKHPCIDSLRNEIKSELNKRFTQ
jgi:hypothetical protein